MKNIIGFDKVALLKCDDCKCIFTIDSPDDVKSWTVNNKKEEYVECPNCKSVCKRFFKLYAKNIHAWLKL